MGLSLPGNRLFCLSRDNLPPESFERIITPAAAWRYVERNYLFDDRWHHSRYIVNIELKPSGYPPPRSTTQGYSARSRLKAMIKRGEVVCLNEVSVLPATLFYIDDKGALLCRDERAFRFGGAKRITEAFNRAVSLRDYRHSGGKPAPTASRELRGGGRETLNGKNVGRLLAAGGLYNGNVEGFRKTAEQLGGDAPAGYNQEERSIQNWQEAPLKT